MRVLVITLGATALQKFDEASGTMQLGLAPHELLAQAAVEGCDTELHQLPVRRCVCMCTGQGAVAGPGSTCASVGASRRAIAAGRSSP